MPRYGNINMRINLDGDESIIWDNLNPSNRSGHAKKLLIDIFKGKNLNEIRKGFIEGIIKDYVINMNLTMDIREEINLNQSNNIDEINLMDSISSIMKGVNK